MQKSNIPSTFPQDSSNQELSLVWTKLNSAPSWKGTAQLYSQSELGQPAKHQITS